MRVEVLKAYGVYSVGAIIPEMPGNVARSMIGRGMVKEVKEPATGDLLGESMTSPADRMMRPATNQSRRQTRR